MRLLREENGGSVYEAVEVSSSPVVERIPCVKISGTSEDRVLHRRQSLLVFDEQSGGSSSSLVCFRSNALRAFHWQRKQQHEIHECVHGTQLQRPSSVGLKVERIRCFQSRLNIWLSRDFVRTTARCGTN